MPKKAIAKRNIKINGKEYKSGEEIPNWRFIKKRTKQSLKNTNRVKVLHIEKEDDTD